MNSLFVNFSKNFAGTILESVQDCLQSIFRVISAAFGDHLWRKTEAGRALVGAKSDYLLLLTKDKCAVY